MNNEPIKCAFCKKVITDKTEVEYSRWLTEYFCNHNCAVDYFFDYMQCTPFQFEPDEMKENKVKLIRGKLHYKE